MSSSSTSPPPIYDVFVSFEGVDVKETFILNLFKRLKQVGINHFEDDDNEGDAKTNKKRLEAISNARFALVVLSENYVKSQARQNELVKIFEHQEKHRSVFVVIPIFHMDRDEISNLESRGDCAALAEVKTISRYYELKAANNESKLIEKIVEGLVNLINSQYSEKIFAFGPSGGRPRKEWKSNDIKGIHACYADFIKSIDFGVGDNTSLEPVTKYDSKREESIFQYQNKYLTSMSGTYKDDRITSLKLRTNKNTTEIIGDEKDGIPFSSPATDGKLVGFYEWSGTSLRQIGAYFDTWPSEGENSWDDGTFDGVREIHGLVKQNIRYIKFVYDDGSEKGCTFIHGDDKEIDSSKEQHLILEDYPREYLTWIYGSMGADGSILSLTFYSNRRGLGSIGVGRAAEPDFSYPSTGSRIIGFYGTGGNTLNSIGVHAEPIPHLYPFKISRPFGGSGGEQWDDGVHSAVRGFRVIVSPRNIIQSISFRYDFNGSLVECHRPGGGDVPSGGWEMLNFPMERLVGISFIVDDTGHSSGTTIRDLRISTTTRDLTYAWTGKPAKAGITFISEKDKENRIVGFFGSASSHLISIGAHLEPYLD